MTSLLTLNKDRYNLCIHQKKEQAVVIDKHALSKWYEANKDVQIDIRGNITSLEAFKDIIRLVETVKHAEGITCPRCRDRTFRELGLEPYEDE